MKVKDHRQSVVRWMLAGLAGVVLIGGHARDAGAASVCNAALDSLFLSGPNFVVPGDATRDTVRLQLTLGAGTITGAPVPPGPQLTLHRLRFDLDCSTGALPCGDQGDVVSYGGDSTVTTDCPGVSWTTNVPGGGSATNEIVFTPSTPITIAGGVTNFCHLEFDLIVVNPEPTSGAQSDATPLVIEEVVGFVQAAAFANGDATCNNNLQAGNQGSTAIPQCPVPCAGDECTDRVCPDDTTNPNAGTCVGTPKTSQPCTDTDGNVCTIAGCEVSPTNAELGVCVQTHTFATDSTPCPDGDGDACTTAGCNGAGVCDQNHMTVTCHAVDECNGGCDKTSGQCTPKVSTPCTDTDGNICTIAGCELSPGDPTTGVCVQNHMFEHDSVPCPDTDGNACTTAGCNGAGVCDQNHMSKTCPGADECNGGCDTTSGRCTPKVSTPCTDTDSNVCTLAGCEVSPTNPDLGVCVQTHMSASDSTPCPDSDNNACTTAGCNGQGVCDQSHMVNPGGSNCANPIVGGAGDCTVLELDGSKVDITGPPGGIVGDICIGPNGHLSITGSEFVTGNVRLASGATFSKSGSGTVGGGLTGVELTTEINAAIAASANAASQACTINLTSIMDATTINATGGGTAPTVVCVQSVVLNGRTVTLSGVA